MSSVGRLPIPIYSSLSTRDDDEDEEDDDEDEEDDDEDEEDDDEDDEDEDNDDEEVPMGVEQTVSTEANNRGWDGWILSTYNKTAGKRGGTDTKIP